MQYKKNKKLDYIFVDNSAMAVYDSLTGTTWIFDERGIDILHVLEKSCTMETLIEKLCLIYDSKPEEIKAEVEEFLEITIEKGVVIRQ